MKSKKIRKAKKYFSFLLALAILSTGTINVFAHEVNELNKKDELDYLIDKYSSNSIIFVADENGNVSEILMININENPSKELLKISKKLDIPIHKEIPKSHIPNIPKLITSLGWTYNSDRDIITSKHFQTLTRSAIAAGIAGLFGGTISFWGPLASVLIGNDIVLHTKNVHFYAQHFYRYSDDIYLPFYVKKQVHCYEGPEFEGYIDSETRYYYSTAPY